MYGQLQVLYGVLFNYSNPPFEYETLIFATHHEKGTINLHKKGTTVY